MAIIINALILMGVLGLISGTFLAFAAKKFEVKEDIRVAVAEKMLPGVNCGACGFPGCPAFAKAYVKGEAKNDGCLPGRRAGVPDKLKKLSEIKDDDLNAMGEKLGGDIQKIIEEIMK